MEVWREKNFVVPRAGYGPSVNPRANHGNHLGLHLSTPTPKSKRPTFALDDAPTIPFRIRVRVCLFVFQRPKRNKSGHIGHVGFIFHFPRRLTALDRSIPFFREIFP